MPPTTPAASPEFFGQSRVEAFSDGVFAIIVTLLVLELQVPALPEAAPESVPALGHARLGLPPRFGSWVVSSLRWALPGLTTTGCWAGSGT